MLASIAIITVSRRGSSSRKWQGTVRLWTEPPAAVIYASFGSNLFIWFITSSFKRLSRSCPYAADIFVDTSCAEVELIYLFF